MSSADYAGQLITIPTFFLSTMVSSRLFFRTKISIHFAYRRCATSSISAERIISGIQPTGTMHLGNYLGAIKNWVNLQNCVGGVMCSDVQKLPENILTMVASLLACGIDPEKSVIFLQSQVAEHTQLCWVLGCLCTSARLARMPQYREKSLKLKETGLGLYIYPILQAADILIHQATKVPVGIDQVQHLQLARELARKFNQVYGETFPVPSPVVIDDCGSKIKDLCDPILKMSKSSSTTKGRIEITDSPDAISGKIKKALSDSNSAITYDPIERPGVSNLIAIHASLTKRTPAEICSDVRNLDTGQYKLIVAEVVIEALRPIREEILRLNKDKAYLTGVLQRGADTATCTASETWKLVKKRTGIHANVC